MIRRRELSGAIAAAVAWPAALACAEQPRKIARVGILSGLSPAQVGLVYEPLKSELGRLGYQEGVDIAYEFAWAEGRYERLASLAAGLVNNRVDVIFTVFTAGALAAKRATATTPIVTFSNNPIESGLAASLARPGGNVTGVMSFSLDIVAKQLETLKKILPRITQVLILGIANDPTYAQALAAAKAAGDKLGLSIEALGLHSASIERDLLQSAPSHVQALIVLGYSQLHAPSPAKQIAHFARRHGIPWAATVEELVGAGALFSYGTTIAHFFILAARQIARILKGANPAELPIELPTEFKLVINMSAAKELNIVVPNSVLAVADRVIE
jgi:putative ABC transport system substrate-binding protein